MAVLESSSDVRARVRRGFARVLASVGSGALLAGVLAPAAAVEPLDIGSYDGPIHESVGDGTVDPAASVQSSGEAEALAEAAQTGMRARVARAADAGIYQPDHSGT